MHLASQKTIFHAVSTLGKLNPHVAPTISLTIKLLYELMKNN